VQRLRDVDEELIELVGRERLLLAAREQLLELIENQDRRDEAIVGTPEALVVPPHVLPDGLRRRIRRHLVSPAAGRAADLLEALLGERRRGAVVAQPHVDREDVGGSQRRKETGAEQRRLAEAGDAREQREVLAQDRPQQRVDFSIAPLE